MAQHDYVIANGSGSAVRGDLNNALAAIVSNNSGTSEPSPTYSYQFWADTTTGLLKIRNAANNAWITLRELDGTLVIEAGTVTAPGLYFVGDSNTGIYSPAADQFAITTGGVERLRFDGSGAVFNENSTDYDFRIEGDNNANLFYVDASEDEIGIGTNAPAAGFHVAIPTVSATIGNIYIAPSTAGQARLHLYNGGATAEWLIGQKTSTDHDFKVTKSVGGTETDYLVVDTSGNTTIRDRGALRLADTDSSHYVALRSPATVTTNVTWDLPADDGTADQVLKTDGSGALGWATRVRMVLETAKTATGTQVDFTGIPSWVKRVTVMFNGVSTNGSSIVQVQLGTSGGIQTTGYNGVEAGVAGTNTTSVSTSNTGASATSTDAAASRFGNIVFSMFAANTFSFIGITGNPGTGNTMISGLVALSGTLDRVRISTVNGTDTFDAGSINILYEG